MNTKSSNSCAQVTPNNELSSSGKFGPPRILALAVCMIIFSFGAVAAIARPAATDPVELYAPQVTVAAQRTVAVPLTISDTTGLGIIAYQFNMRYDPSVLQVNPVPIEIEGTLSESMAFAVNPNTPGLLRVAVYGAYPLADEGVLLKLRFTAVGATGATTNLIWDEVLLNEGDPQHVVTDGSVTIATPMMFYTSVRGRLIGGFGDVIAASARVELIGSDGIYRTVLTNAKGYFEFGRVPTEQTYTLSVSSGDYRFRPVRVDVKESPVEVEVRSDSKGMRDR